MEIQDAENEMKTFVSPKRETEKVCVCGVCVCGEGGNVPRWIGTQSVSD